MTSIQEISEEELKNELKPPKYTLYQRLFQIFCFLIFGGPIRFLICLIIYFLMIVIISSLRLILDSFGFNINFGKKLLTLLIRAATRVLLFGFGIYYIHFNGKIEENEVRFIISNHISFFDAFIILSIRNITFFIKLCFKKILIFEPIYTILDPVFGKFSCDKNSCKEIIDRADSFNHYPILVFPEGSPTNGKIITKFHKIAFSTPYKVQPMLIRYWIPLIPEGWNTCAWRQNSIYEHFWSFLSLPFCFVTVDILPPISMDNEGKSDIHRFKRESQLIMSNYLRIKPVNKKSFQNIEENSEKIKVE